MSLTVAQSTPQTADRTNWQAALETLAATTGVLLLCVLSESLAPVAWVSCAGWVFLLRTEVSKDRAERLFAPVAERVFPRLERPPFGFTKEEKGWNGHFTTYVICLLVLFIGSFLTRAVSVAWTLITHCVLTLGSLRENWWRATFVVNLNTPLDLAPVDPAKQRADVVWLSLAHPSDTSLFDRRSLSAIYQTFWAGLGMSIATALAFAIFWVFLSVVEYGAGLLLDLLGLSSWKDGWLWYLAFSARYFFYELVSVAFGVFVAYVLLGSLTYLFINSRLRVILFVLPAFYRLCLKATAVVYMPLIWWGRILRNQSDVIDQIRWVDETKSAFLVLIISLLAILKFLFLVAAANIPDLLSSEFVSIYVRAFLSNGQEVPLWSYVAATSGALYVVLYFTCDYLAHQMRHGPVQSLAEDGWATRLLVGYSVLAKLFSGYLLIINMITVAYYVPSLLALRLPRAGEVFPRDELRAVLCWLKIGRC